MVTTHQMFGMEKTHEIIAIYIRQARNAFNVAPSRSAADLNL